MSKRTMIMLQYDNKANGGRERVYRDGERYFINSDWGDGFSMDLTPVTKDEMKIGLEWTNAPAEIVERMLA